MLEHGSQVTLATVEMARHIRTEQGLIAVPSDHLLSRSPGDSEYWSVYINDPGLTIHDEDIIMYILEQGTPGLRPRSHLRKKKSLPLWRQLALLIQKMFDLGYLFLAELCHVPLPQPLVQLHARKCPFRR
jgi:hypothetical protein